MDNADYSDPVSKLLTYGDGSLTENKWPDYLALGLTEAHIPELIRMMTDEFLLLEASSESEEVWAPLHAWRALGQLGATQAIKPMIAQFDLIDNGEDEWMGTEFPHVFAMIGPESISPLWDCLRGDEQYSVSSKICVAESLGEIGKAHPDSRDRCVALMTEQLRKYSANDPGLNGFLIYNLARLKASESLKVIRTAYEKECVDYAVLGDFEDAEIKMGLKSRRSTPQPEYKLVFRDGIPLRVKKTPGKKKKIGRNEPCPCGSGKKYKKCCLNKV